MWKAQMLVSHQVEGKYSTFQQLTTAEQGVYQAAIV